MTIHYWVGQLLTIALPTLLLVTVLIVSVRYWVVWFRSNKRNWRGLLPLHVGVISSSYLMLMALAAAEVRTLYEDRYASQEFWWKLALVSTAEVFGIAAMVIIFGFGKKSSGSAKIKRRPEPQHRST